MDRQELLSALEKVSPGLSNSSSIVEQSSHFAFKDGRVYTYNDEVSVSHPVEGLDIEAAVLGDKLHNLLKKLKKDEVEAWTEGNELKLKSGKTKSGITLQQEVKMPLQPVPSEDELSPLPTNFIQAVQFALFSCSKDTSTPALTCVHLNRGEGAVESTDSYRMTRYHLDEELPADILIPSSSAKELARYNISSACADDSWAHFVTTDGTVFSTRLISKDYPDIGQFFDSEGSVKIQLPKSISEMLERAGIFASRKYMLDEYVKITIKDRKMSVYAYSGDGWIEETANISYKGELSFITNPAFLADMCKETRECEIGENTMKFSTNEWEHVMTLTKGEQ